MDEFGGQSFISLNYGHVDDEERVPPVHGVSQGPSTLGISQWPQHGALCYPVPLGYPLLPSPQPISERTKDEPLTSAIIKSVYYDLNLYIIQQL
ncbi:hypothetical protein TNCV_2611481 [Trichonephila clavipes]|nr:hypothetical protein TNCV_2611481 [Trichonephila clavipes]